MPEQESMSEKARRYLGTLYRVFFRFVAQCYARNVKGEKDSQHCDRHDLEGDSEPNSPRHPPLEPISPAHPSPQIINIVTPPASEPTSDVKYSLPKTAKPEKPLHPAPAIVPGTPKVYPKSPDVPWITPPPADRPLPDRPHPEPSDPQVPWITPPPPDSTNSDPDELCSSDVVSTPNLVPSIPSKPPVPKALDLDFKLEMKSSHNPLCSKQLPSKYMDAFSAEYGPEITSLVNYMYERRLMWDCERVPSEYLAESWEESWSAEAPTRDTHGERMLHELIGLLRKAGKKFTDPHFPPEDISLFANPASTLGTNAGVEQTFRKDQDPFLAGVKGVEWKEPQAIGNPASKPVIFSGDISPDDVAQGRLGNCYFLAAIASCADGEEDHLITDLVVEQGIDVGIFGIKFYVNGRWTLVIVDDKFPCVQSHGRWTPIFASPKAHRGQAEGEKELWSMIFEKAWAKLHLSYEATAGGLTDDANNYLSGGINSSVSLGADLDEEWRVISSLASADDAAFLSTHTRTLSEDELSSVGLIGGHAYSILATHQTQEGLRLVQVRNPWGSIEWTGDYSDKSPLWTEELRTAVSQKNEEDGSFWMEWKDFVHYYSDVAVCDPRMLCKMYSDKIARVDGVSAQWIAHQTAGGKSTAATFKYNPHFELVVEGPEVYISIYQPDIRAIEALREIEWQRIHVYLIDPARPAEATQIMELAYQRQAAHRAVIQPGTKYTLVVTSWAPGVQGVFALTASGHNCTLRPLPPPTPSAADAARMAARAARQPVCIVCGKDIEGRYYNTPDGPVLFDHYEAYKNSKRHPAPSH